MATRLRPLGHALRIDFLAPNFTCKLPNAGAALGLGAATPTD
jgi:hypothetical protein